MKKYVVTQEFINELIEWRDENDIKLDEEDVSSYVIGEDIMILSNKVKEWWQELNNPRERNNRLIAIIQWLNGENVFDVEASHKYVVRSTDKDGDYWYVTTENAMAQYVYRLPHATKFDTYEEAKEWANAHQVVVEVDENGK